MTAHAWNGIAMSALKAWEKKTFILSGSDLAGRHGEYFQIRISKGEIGYYYRVNIDDVEFGECLFLSWVTGFGLAGTDAELSADPDFDGLDNEAEYIHGTSPCNGDSDDDGMPDDWEVVKGLSPTTNDAAVDSDSDSLSNLQEYGIGTNPNDPDSDFDIVSDGDEVNIYGTNPLDSDSDGDGVSDAIEIYSYNTNPLEADSDFDGLGDSQETDLFSLTGSIGSR